jgi:hypothetical protein
VLALLIAICGVLAALAKEYDQTTTAAAAARKAADLSLTLYRDGASSYLDVVTAQSTALEAERLAIALHTRQLVAEIGLMLALGGGWIVPHESPAKPLWRLILRNSVRSLSTGDGQCGLPDVAQQTNRYVPRFSTIIYNGELSLA